MVAYYNENDPFASQWLRNLIKAGHIAAGDVDDRSIVDVGPDDLRGYTQCHFFAGIGGWSYALRLAGWPDDRPVWTGSCPCQPFSAAGKGKAADDEHHLWPAWFSLIAECCPAIVFGEQVEAAIGWGWLDLVCSDLESQGYAVGAAVLPACSVGAPHIRQRLWFVAMDDAERDRRRTRRRDGDYTSDEWVVAHANGGDGIVADADSSRQRAGRPSETSGGRDAPRIEPAGLCASLGMVNPAREQMGLPRCSRQSGEAIGELGNAPSNGERQSRLAEKGDGRSRQIGRSSPWRNLEWLPCTDGKARPVEPCTFPLAHGIPGRVGRLRAYGNAIVPQVAAQFIAATMTANHP